jgi:hypothetical protein
MFTANQKAPRMGKAAFSTQVFTRELYKKFLREFPEYKELTWKEFKTCWEEITATIREEGVMNPLGVKLGFYLGEIKTQFLPHKKKAVDRKASAEAGEVVTHLNLVTRGKVAKIKWERRWAVNFNKILQLYAFEPDQKMNKIAKTYIPENPEKLRVARITLGGKRTWR